MSDEKELSTEISFIGSNPGAVQYGNFINYYQFHPAESRINVLPMDIWIHQENQIYHALDVGCNAGNLTQALYEFLSKCLNKSECKIYGIDIDQLLIERAILHNKYNDKIIYKCMNIMHEVQQQTLITKCLPSNKDRFNAVFCFSVTMWIHLNHGDEGLYNFLQYLCNITNLLIIEPQPWKCYRTALRRMKKSHHTFHLFESLRLRENVDEEIIKILTKLNFIKLKETPSSEWGRRIIFFVRGSEQKK